MIFVVILLVGLSLLAQHFDVFFVNVFGFSFNHALWNRQETYLAISTLIGVGFVGAIDDYLNVRGIGRTK